MVEHDTLPSPDPPDQITGMEIAISTLLRAGILVSLSLVLLGVIVTFIRHPELVSSAEALEYLKSDQYAFPTRLGAVFTGALAGQGRSIIMLGVFVLFLTPVLRVAVSIVAYIREKDWPFTLITSTVLGLLLLSLVLGKAG